MKNHSIIDDISIKILTTKAMGGADGNKKQKTTWWWRKKLLHWLNPDLVFVWGEIFVVEMRFREIFLLFLIKRIYEWNESEPVRSFSSLLSFHWKGKGKYFEDFKIQNTVSKPKNKKIKIIKTPKRSGHRIDHSVSLRLSFLETS